MPAQHVKWLKELQEERRRKEETKEAEDLEQLTRKRTFMEREAKKRAAGKLESEQSNIDNDTESIISDDVSVASSKVSDNVKKKPAWCHSETAHEASEINKESDLISFVNGLDFEQYTQDLELQTLMDQLRKRIKLLELERKKDTTKLQSCLDVSTGAFHLLRCLCIMITCILISIVYIGILFSE